MLFHSDPLHIENMTDSKKILFVESQSDRNFVDTFRSQADMSRLSSDSNLVPPNLRRGEGSTVVCQDYTSRSANNVLNSKRYSLSSVLNETVSVGMTVHNRNTVNSVVHDDANSDDMPMDVIKKFDLHFNEENYYYPFRITHWSGIDKCKMSSFLVSFCDKSRYQAADRSGMFVGNPMCNTLVYEDFDEYQHSYMLRQAQVGLDDHH